MFALLIAAALSGQVPVYPEVRTGGIYPNQPMTSMWVTLYGPGGLIATGRTGSDGQIVPNVGRTFPVGTKFTMVVSDMLRTRTRTYGFTVQPPIGPGLPRPQALQAIWEPY